MAGVYKVALICVLIILLSISCMAESEKFGSLKVENDFYNFGFLPIDYRVSHTYKIINDGQGVLNITRLLNNCDCTTARITNREIDPGDSAKVTIIFHTKNYYGQTTRTVTIFSNDPEKPEYDLKYKAELGLFPKLYKTNPISLILLPSSKNKAIRILNNSEEDIDFEIEYLDNMYFSVDVREGNIGGKDSALVNVSPIDSTPPGTHYCNFTVVYKAEEDIRITIPIRVVKY